MKAWKVMSFAIFVCVAIMAVMASCGDDDDDNDNDDGEPVTETLTFATYNVGLAYGFVPLAEERQSALLEVVPSLDADVLCMQEVWTDEDYQYFISPAESFEYHYRYDSKPDFADLPDEPAPCDDLSALLACVEEHCAGLGPDELMECVITNCALELFSLDDDCISCLAGNIDQPFNVIVDTCTTPGPPPISYEGSNGLLLLSNTELTETEMLQLEFFLTVRVVLHAKIETELGPLHLFCTHLTAEISTLPYNGDFASYEEEQAAQIEDLLAWIDEKAGDEPAVVMGDFNCGPGTGGAPDEFVDNYNALLAGELVDPYAEQNPDLCTYCDDNPLVEAGSLSQIIDHVFFKNFSEDATYTSERIFDDPITLEIDGAEQESRLSDHYGVSVESTRQESTE